MQRVLVTPDSRVLLPQVGVEADPLAKREEPAQQVGPGNVIEEALEIARSVCDDRLAQRLQLGNAVFRFGDGKIQRAELGDAQLLQGQHPVAGRILHLDGFGQEQRVARQGAARGIEDHAAARILVDGLDVVVASGDALGEERQGLFDVDQGGHGRTASTMSAMACWTAPSSDTAWTTAASTARREGIPRSMSWAA